MTLTRNSILILSAWAFFVGGFLLTSMLAPRLPVLENFSYVLACIVPLFCNTFLLWNAASPYRRQNGFWMLLALGCTLWLSGHHLHRVWAAEPDPASLRRGSTLFSAHRSVYGGHRANASCSKNARNASLWPNRSAAARNRL